MASSPGLTINQSGFSPCCFRGTRLCSKCLQPSRTTLINQSNLNVEDVKFVINFDYPNSSEDYIHRIGRTGRSEQTGTAYTFFTPNNSRQARDLINVLQEAKQEINPKLAEMARRSGGGNGYRGNNKWGYAKAGGFGNNRPQFHKRFNDYS